MIKLYIYNQLDGCFLYEDTGSTDVIINNITEEKDFTLTRPLNYSQLWYWVDNKWQSEPKQD